MLGVISSTCKLLVVASGDRSGHTTVGLSSQGVARRRVKGLFVVASGGRPARSSSHRAAHRCVGLLDNRVGLLVGSPGGVRRLRRNSSRLVGIAHRPQRARHRVRGSSSLRQQGWPPLHREDHLAQTGSNLCVRLLVTAEIVASWSSISKQFIAQQVVASRGRSASRQKTRQLAWGRVRRLIVVASGGRLWVYQAASRHVRKPLVASFHQEGAVIALRSSSRQADSRSLRQGSLCTERARRYTARVKSRIRM